MTISATTQGIKPGVCLSTNKPANPFDGQVIYMTDVDQTAVWDGTQWTVLAPIAGNRNVLINGGLDVWQRGTSFTTGGVYSADRFIIGRSGGGSGATFTRVSPSDSTNLPFFRYAMRCQRDSGNTATNGLTFNQVVETANSIRLAGKQVTLSFYARCGANYTTGTNFYSYVFTGTGTDQNGVLGAWTGSANPINASHTLTTTWQRFSATGTFSSTANEIFISISSAHTGTAGANDWFEITGVQLEAGAVATPFEFEDYGTTLQKCQRYYEKTYDSGTAPGTATYNGMFTSGNFSNATNNSIIAVRFKVEKRASPTMTAYKPADGASGSWGYSRSGASGSSTVSFDLLATTGCRAYHDIGAAWTGNVVEAHWVASAEL